MIGAFSVCTERPNPDTQSDTRNLKRKSMKLRWIFLLTTGLLLTGSAFGQAPARTSTPNGSPQSSSAQAAPLTPDAAAKLQKRAEDFLRNLYAWGSEFEVKADEPKPSPIADLYEMNVKVGLQGQSDS